MTRFIKLAALTSYVAMALSLSACSTLSSAYDSVSTTVSDVFKSDDAKK